MNIERGIHDRWSTDAMLTALLPADRLFTGHAEGNPRRPYGVLVRLESAPQWRTSSGTRLDEVRLELTIWTDRLPDAQRIVAAALRKFDRAAFDLEEGRVATMRRVRQEQRREEDGAWRTTLTFLALHEVNPTGALSDV